MRGKRPGMQKDQGVTKRCRLSLLTNSALVILVQMRGRGGVAWSQPMSTAVHITWHGSQINFGDLPPYLTYKRDQRDSSENKENEKRRCYRQGGRQISRHCPFNSSIRLLASWIFVREHYPVSLLKRSKKNILPYNFGKRIFIFWNKTICMHFLTRNCVKFPFACQNCFELANWTG